MVLRRSSPAAAAAAAAATRTRGRTRTRVAVAVAAAAVSACGAAAVIMAALLLRSGLTMATPLVPSWGPAVESLSCDGSEGAAGLPACCLESCCICLGAPLPSVVSAAARVVAPPVVEPGPFVATTLRG
jgi:hypothetical protein